MKTNIKKIVVLTAIILSGVFMPGNVFADEVHSPSAKLAPIVEKKDVNILDTRVKALENIFTRYGSPLAEESWAYVKYADEYGVDWRLLPAIAGLESFFGKHLMPGSYNAYGWGGGYIYFESWEDGIRAINKSLAERYYGRGATTVWTIGPIYAESPTWAVRVNSFMQQIEAEYLRLSVFAALPSI